MTNDRLREIIGIVKKIADRHVFTLPVDIEAICRAYGGRLTSLDDCESLGLDREVVIDCMGNKDGVATRGNKVWGIIYDSSAPSNRLRFTLAEEFMHTILGHTADRRFDAVDPSYDHEVYMRYEEEAKVAAGLLLMPPRVWRRYERTVGAKGIGKLCGVSDAFVYVWQETMNKYAEIMNKYAYDIGANLIWEGVNGRIVSRKIVRPVCVGFDGEIEV